MRSLSTAISDLVLALSVYFLIYHRFGTSLFACLGLAFQGAAATVGVARFAMDRPPTRVLNTHASLSWLAAAIGMNIVAISYTRPVAPTLMTINFLVFVAMLVMGAHLTGEQRVLAKQAASGFAMLSILFSCYLTSNWNGIIGATIYVVAGLVVGSEGVMGGMPRVDLLHYLLALGNLFFLWSL